MATEDAGTRLDKFLASRLAELSRTQVQRLIQEGRATDANGPLIARYRVREGETIALHVPPPRPSELAAEPLALDILHEDDDLLVIDKPAGLVVHPAPGHPSGTLVNALLYHCRSLSGIGGEARPGIIHRLDKDTSGLLLVAKHDRSHRHLAAQLKTRELQRRYQALVYGSMPAQEGTVDAPVGRHPTPAQEDGRRGARRPGSAYSLPSARSVGRPQPAGIGPGDGAARTRSASISLPSATPCWATPPTGPAPAGGRADRRWSRPCGPFRGRPCTPRRCAFSTRRTAIA